MEMLSCDSPKPTYAAMWHKRSISRYQMNKFFLFTKVPRRKLGHRRWLIVLGTPYAYARCPIVRQDTFLDIAEFDILLFVSMRLAKRSKSALDWWVVSRRTTRKSGGIPFSISFKSKILSSELEPSCGSTLSGAEELSSSLSYLTKGTRWPKRIFCHDSRSVGSGKGKIGRRGRFLLSRLIDFEKA